MPQGEHSSRRYTEREVGRILRRATELQRLDDPAADHGGLTLNELMEVGREVGIDPALLRRAAAELDRGVASGPWERLLGAPVGFTLERTVPGEFSASGFEQLVPLMQVATVGQGTASAVGKTLTWSSRSDTNTSSQQVLITVQSGETRIRIEERLAGFAGGLFGGLIGGGGGVAIGVGGALGGMLGSVALAVALPAAALGSAYIGARAIFAAHVRKRRRRMEDLLDRLAERIETLVERQAVEGGGPPAGRISPPPSSP